MSIYLHFFSDRERTGIEFGSDLPDTQNISLEKIESLGKRILSKQSESSEGDLIIDLTHQRAEWKPISDENRIQELTLTQNELDELKTILGIQKKPPISKKLPAPKGVSALKGKKGKWFSNLLRRVYADHFVIKPTIKKQLGKKLSDIPPENLRPAYIDLFDGADDWISSLKERYSDLETLFSNDELETMYEDRLIKHINRKLNTANRGRLTQTELRKFRALRKLRKFERQSIPDKNFLDSLAVLDIPLDELAEIEITEVRKPALINTWKRIIEELVSTGNLEHLNMECPRKERITQIEHACKFIHTLELIPENLLDSALLEDLKNQFPVAELTNFIIHEEAYLDTDISLENPILEQKREIYRKKINPQCDKLLKIYKNQRDADKIAKVLVNFNNHKLVQTYICSTKYLLTEEEKEIFPESQIADFFYRKLEKFAIDDFDLTPKQIDNLRQHQMAPIRIEKAKEQLSHAIEEFRKIKETGRHENEAAQEILRKVFPRISKILGEAKDFPKVFSLTGITDDDRAFLIAAYSAFITSYLGTVPLDLINQTDDEKKLLPYLIPIVEAKKACRSISAPEEIQNLFDRFETDIKNEKAQELLRLPPDEVQKRYDEISTWDDRFFRNDGVIEDFLSQDFDHPSQLTKETAAKLIEISRMIYKARFDKKKLSPKEKARCSKLLIELSNIPDISKNLNPFLKKNQLEDCLDVVPSIFHPFLKPDIEYQESFPVGINYEAIEVILDLIKMKKNYDENKVVLEKAERLLDKYNNPKEEIVEQDRLTYQELGQVYRAQKIALKEFKALEIEEDTIKMLVNQASEAKQLYGNISQLILDDANKTYLDGDLSGYVGKKKKAWIDHPLSYLERSVILIADHNVTHGVKLYHHPDGHVRCSHVEDEYEDTPLDLYHMAISDMWRLNFSPLFSSDIMDLLQNIYGDDVEKEIRKVYEEAENKIHNQDYKIENSPYRIMKAGLATFAPIVNLFSPLTRKKIEKHKGQEEQDFSKIYNGFIEGEGVNQEQICSEFVSASTLAALISVNKQLAAKLKNEFPRLDQAKVLQDLERKGYALDPDVREYLEGKRYFGKERSKTKKAERRLKKILRDAVYNERDIDVIIRVNNEEIFDLPYDKRERIEAIHPGRMISLLEKKKYVEKVPPPKAFTDLIQSID